MSNNRFGIGTAAPVANLQVAGDAVFNTNVAIGISTATTNRLHVQSGSTAFVINQNGNVGIGISNPTSSLHVVGTVNATTISTGSLFIGILSVASVATNNFTATNITSTNVSVSGSISSAAIYAGTLSAASADIGGTLSVVGNTRIAGGLSVLSNATVNGSLSVLTNATISGNLSILADVTVNGNLILKGNVTTDMNSERLEVVNNGTGPAFKVNQIGSEPVMVVQRNTSNVLVVDATGDTLVNGNLSVSGTISAATVIANNISGLTQISAATAFVGTGIIDNISASGTISAATIIANNISGLTQISAATAFVGTGIIDNISTSGTVSAATIIANNISGLTQISAATIHAGNLSVSSNITTSSLVVDTNTIFTSSGNVGIGTTAPTATLHVQDTFRSGSNTGKRFIFGTDTYGLKIENGTNNGYAPAIMGTAYDSNDSGLFLIGVVSAAATAVQIDGRLSNGTLTSGNILRITNFDADRVVVDSIGEVGIGTSTPSSKLHVYDDTSTGIAANIYQNNTVGHGLFITCTGTSVNRQALLVSTGTSSNTFVVNLNGTVGIGSGTPVGLLDVSGHISTATSNFWVADAGSANSTTDEFSSVVGPTTYPLSIVASNYIRAAAYVITSDRRLKKDITEIDDGESLAQLRKIEPTKYRYIETKTKTNRIVYGFIAQQVAEHFPEAVSLGPGTVPDIYSLGEIKESVITLKIPHNLSVNDEISYYINKKECSNTILSGKVASVITDYTFMIEMKVNLDFIGQVFVIGRKVKDFHSLNKDYLFTINFAATQELDRQQQRHQTQLQTMQTTIDQLQQENASLKNKLEAVMAHLGLSL